jgi:aspartyl-tRNA(Asn)/glutamyl-tRNA(Gln) amidotransferase subunit A
VTDACLDRMETLNSVLNYAVNILTDQARSDAHAVDETCIKPKNPAPLLGVPLAHKDVYYRAG